MKLRCRIPGHSDSDINLNSDVTLADLHAIVAAQYFDLKHGEFFVSLNNRDPVGDVIHNPEATLFSVGIRSGDRVYIVTNSTSMPSTCDLKDTRPSNSLLIEQVYAENSQQMSGSDTSVVHNFLSAVENLCCKSPVHWIVAIVNYQFVNENNCCLFNQSSGHLIEDWKTKIDNNSSLNVYYSPIKAAPFCVSFSIIQRPCRTKNQLSFSPNYVQISTVLYNGFLVQHTVNIGEVINGPRENPEIFQSLLFSIDQKFVSPVSNAISNSIMSPILSLPQELLTRISENLSVKYFLNFTSTCYSLYKLVSDEKIWRTFCRRDFSGKTIKHNASCLNQYVSWHETVRSTRLPAQAPDFWPQPFPSHSNFPVPLQPNRPDRPLHNPDVPSFYPDDVFPDDQYPFFRRPQPRTPSLLGGPEDLRPPDPFTPVLRQPLPENPFRPFMRFDDGRFGGSGPRFI